VRFTVDHGNRAELVFEFRLEIRVGLTERRNFQSLIAGLKIDESSQRLRQSNFAFVGFRFHHG
jgi:hypothetical protein